jgi:allantoinase
MSQRTVITGGLLVTDTDEFKADLVVDDDQVVALLADAEGVDADEEIDARDLLILPGGIDAHLSAPWLSNGEHAPAALADQRAAAAGGVTTLIADAGSTIDADAAKAHLGADLALWHPVSGGAVPSAERLARLAQAGIAGFSARVGSAGTGTAAAAAASLSDADLLALMRAGANLQVPISLAVMHPEIDATEPLAEVAAVTTALLFAQHTGAWVHFRHLSTAGSMQQIVEARARQVRVTASVSPMHLALPASNDTRELAVTPPLRSQEEIDHLWAYVLDETVDFIASNSVSRDGAQTPDVQTALSLFWDEAVNKRGMSRSQAVRQLATNPAQMFGLYPRKGSIRVGSDADLVLFDPEGAWTVRHGDMLHEPRWSAFDGRSITGFVVRTLRRGTTIYDAERHDDASVVEAGSGTILSRATIQ